MSMTNDLTCIYCTYTVYLKPVIDHKASLEYKRIFDQSEEAKYRRASGNYIIWNKSLSIYKNVFVTEATHTTDSSSLDTYIQVCSLQTCSGLLGVRGAVSRD